jgi:hypothetical protein
MVERFLLLVGFSNRDVDGPAHQICGLLRFLAFQPGCIQSFLPLNQDSLTFESISFVQRLGQGFSIFAFIFSHLSQRHSLS